MDFVANLVSKVGGDDALNMINDNLTPLLLNSFRPKISDYVGTHVERTRGELFTQLPDGVRNVLDDIIPGGLNASQSRGVADDAKSFFDDIGNQIRQKIGEILDQTRERVREIVQNVTSSTSDRVTNSVVDIAQNKLKLKTQQRGIENNSQGGDGQTSRGFDDLTRSGSGSGDFIDNFINSSLEEVRPLVRGELKSIYDHIIDLVPQDARKILVAIVPGFKDEQANQGGNNQQGDFNNQQNNFNNQQGNFNDQNQGQFNNQNQGQFNNQNQGQFDNQNQGQFNQQGGSRGIDQEDNEPRSRGFMSDMKNMAHQFKDKVKNEMGNFSQMGGTRDGSQMLEEFQNKAKDKIGRITTELMNQLEGKIMDTVSEELRTVAKSKLSSKLSL